MRACYKILLLVLAFTLSTSTFCFAQSDQQNEADLVRQTELTRIKALVDKDIEVAQQLHTDGFQLINPSGMLQTKEDYIGGLASGIFYYKKWAPSDIEVRMYGNAAVLRYKSQLQAIVMNQDLGETPHWHTNLYEKNDGRWQIVWSHTSIIQ